MANNSAIRRKLLVILLFVTTGYSVGPDKGIDEVSIYRLQGGMIGNGFLRPKAKLEAGLGNTHRAEPHGYHARLPGGPDGWRMPRSVASDSAAINSASRTAGSVMRFR